MSLGWISCKKTNDTVAKVIVVNDQGQRVQGAFVRLIAVSTTNQQSTIPPNSGQTKEDGSVYFDYSNDFNPGQAGFRVLEVEVNVGDSLFGTGIIKIEEEKLTEKTIVVSEL